MSISFQCPNVVRSSSRPRRRRQVVGVSRLRTQVTCPEPIYDAEERRSRPDMIRRRS